MRGVCTDAKVCAARKWDLVNLVDQGRYALPDGATGTVSGCVCTAPWLPCEASSGTPRCTPAMCPVLLLLLLHFGRACAGASLMPVASESLQAVTVLALIMHCRRPPPPAAASAPPGSPRVRARHRSAGTNS